MQVLFGQSKYETPGLFIPDTDWQQIVDICQTRRIIPRELCDKYVAGWICPCILKPRSTRRRNTDVESMSDWIGVDLDHCNMTLRELLGTYFGGVQCVIYSTTNSTALAPRWRVFIKLSREMTTAEFNGVWKALNLLLDGNIDAQTKNLNRLHYLPATWKGSNNDFHVQEGVSLPVDELLDCCPPEEPVFYPELDSTAYRVSNRSAPDGTAIITQAMIDRHMTGTREGGRFIKLLCAAATRYRTQGWDLSASELANEALTVSPTDSNGMRRAMSAYREAERAIQYINSQVQPISNLDKMKANLKWRLSQTK